MPLPDHVIALAAQVSNRGRWGDDDERGTLNLIDAAAIRRGAAAIVTGEQHCLAMPLDEHGPQIGLIPGRDNPVLQMIAINDAMTNDPEAFATSDDRMSLGLQAATHWDALAHVSAGGQLYNGFPASSITEKGAARCGIDRVGALISRGVLLDIPRARGVERLEPGHAIGAGDLDTALAMTGIDLEPGDVVLVRTGQVEAFLDGDRMGYAFPSSGLSIEAPAWFHARDVAAVATDNLTFEVFPAADADGWLPVHVLHLVHMGLLQGQNFMLESLAAACALERRWTFQLSATPEPVTGATGGLVAPVATR